MSNVVRFIDKMTRDVRRECAERVKRSGIWSGAAMSRDENVPGDVTHFLNRASIDELMLAKERELSKGPMLARWKLVAAIDAELHSRKASKNR